MTLRRDFLAMTAGAVAARTVLPMAAKAEPAAGTGNWRRHTVPPGMYPARDSQGPCITDEPDDAALLASIAQFNALEHRIDGFYEPNDPAGATWRGTSFIWGDSPSRWRF
jgi:hypothetical protein